MSTLLRLLAALLTIALGSGCSSSSSGPLAEGEIGSAGGTVTVTSGSYAGTSVTIPANVLTLATRIQIWSSSTIALTGWVIVGPAARFAPDGLALGASGTAVVTYDPSSLPTGTADTDVRVVARDSSGTTTVITPTQVDAMTGLVTTQITAFATLWCVVPDRVAATDYLPLANGNEYLFDFAADNALQVIDATGDQGVTADWRLTFLLPWFHRSGIYLDENGMGGIDFVGLIDSPPQMLATADINDMNVPFLEPIEVVGTSHMAAFTYKVFSIDLNNPPPTQTATGMGTLTVDIERRETVDTAVGRFRNTVVVAWTEDWSDTTGASGSGKIRMWLAKDVGPVQIQIGTDAPAPLRSGTVGGQPISGS